MTIQRQYNLPNCTLALEGFGDGNSSPTDFRPVMSILTNAECQLLGQSVLRGGKDFFEGLVATVSLYAQEVLSGIRVPTSNEETHAVDIERLGPDKHQLTFTPEDGEKQVVEMNTVQLFDLVEAIDQFIADAQTLPQWSLGLKPASKRYAPKEPITQQALPIAAGMGSLAIAAAIFTAIPTPQVKTPEDLTYTPTEQTQNTNTGTTDKLATASPPASPKANTKSSDAKPTVKTDNAKPIEDPELLGNLRTNLEKQLQTNFTPKTPVADTVSYTVTVGKDGKILNYRPDNDTAANLENQTPLERLSYEPVPGSDANAESVARFRAEFTPEGAVRVAPLNAPQSEADQQQTQITPDSTEKKSEASATESEDSQSKSTEAAQAEATAQSAPSADASGTIRQRSQLVALQPKLYDRIDQAWKAPNGLSFKDNLTFSVRVDGEGKIIDYVPYDQPAKDYKSDTPLPELGQEGKIEQKPDSPFARFKVVFTPKGRIEVNPWDGYPEEKVSE